MKAIKTVTCYRHVSMKAKPSLHLPATGPAVLQKGFLTCLIVLIYHVYYLPGPTELFLL